MGTMNIDQNAPVISRDEILIDSPLSTVWGLHTDISSWSEWLPDIDSSTMEGPLEVGTVFHWQTFGLSIESTIREIEPPRRIVWSGPAQGITAIHLWTMTPSENGVRVHTRSRGTVLRCLPSLKSCSGRWTTPSERGCRTSSTRQKPKTHRIEKWRTHPGRASGSSLALSTQVRGIGILGS
jgi:uncharacterized protein YndB with AHSA1/START domain